MPYSDSDRVSGIYTIFNKINNKYYVGESNHVYRRLSFHKNSLKNNKHHNKYLQRAYNKYGKENFEFSLLEDYPENILSDMENYWCNMLDSHNPYVGYNILTTGVGSKRTLSEEQRKNLSVRFSGNKYWLGKNHTSETKEKIRNKRKDQNPSNFRIVEKYSLEGILVQIYSTLREACKDNKCDEDGIRKTAQGKRSSFLGFIWKYKEVKNG